MISMGKLFRVIIQDLFDKFSDDLNMKNDE